MPPTRRRTSGRRDGTSTRHSHLTQTSLSSGHFVFFLFSPPSTQPNPSNQRSGPCYGNTDTDQSPFRSFIITHTDQDPIMHLTSSQLTDPCPYQDNRILPNLVNVPPSLIPFRPCKRPDHVWPSSQGSHIPIHHSVPPGPDRRPKREVHGPASELPCQPALEIPRGLVGVVDGGQGGGRVSEDADDLLTPAQQVHKQNEGVHAPPPSPPAARTSSRSTSSPAGPAVNG